MHSDIYIYAAMDVCHPSTKRQRKLSDGSGHPQEGQKNKTRYHGYGADGYAGSPPIMPLLLFLLWQQQQYQNSLSYKTIYDTPLSKCNTILPTRLVRVTLHSAELMAADNVAKNNTCFILQMCGNTSGISLGIITKF